MFYINAGILPQNCHKVRLNFVSLVFPPVIFYYQKMKRIYRDSNIEVLKVYQIGN